jgi:mRNA-degrading endonuclease RelE of RelBE toxin-antitoxin system
MGKENLKYRLVIFDERIWMRDCDRVPRKQLKRIIERISQLETWSVSASVDVKKLQHYDLADFRLRVGDYRVLLNKNEDKREIHLLRVLHRSKLY